MIRFMGAADREHSQEEPSVADPNDWVGSFGTDLDLYGDSKGRGAHQGSHGL